MKYLIIAILTLIVSTASAGTNVISRIPRAMTLKKKMIYLRGYARHKDMSQQIARATLRDLRVQADTRRWSSVSHRRKRWIILIVEKTEYALPPLRANEIREEISDTPGAWQQWARNHNATNAPALPTPRTKPIIRYKHKRPRPGKGDR